MASATRKRLGWVLLAIAAAGLLIWQLVDTSHAAREQRAIRLIGAGFALLVIYLIAQVTYTFVTGGRPAPSG